LLREKYSMGTSSHILCVVSRSARRWNGRHACTVESSGRQGSAARPRCRSRRAVYIGRLFRLPPADALLRKVDRKYTDSGQLIVGVSQHVTYWNYLGWSGPFSSEAYTERQSAYGLRFHLDSVCTPQTGDQRRGTDRRPRQLRSPSCNPKGAATASREDTYCFSQP
jgi:hypothetical protein